MLSDYLNMHFKYIIMRLTMKGYKLKGQGLAQAVSTFPNERVQKLYTVLVNVVLFIVRIASEGGK